MQEQKYIKLSTFIITLISIVIIFIITLLCVINYYEQRIEDESSEIVLVPDALNSDTQENLTIIE